MVRFIVGSGDDRKVVDMAFKGKELHEQRRAVKKHLGLIR